eukprot:3937126-Rhodomonas_salina.4
MLSSQVLQHHTRQPASLPAFITLFAFIYSCPCSSLSMKRCRPPSCTASCHPLVASEPGLVRRRAVFASVLVRRGAAVVAVAAAGVCGRRHQGGGPVWVGAARLPVQARLCRLFGQVPARKCSWPWQRLPLLNPATCGT